jgi:Ca2+-binding RTX toxin-like protein
MATLTIHAPMTGVAFPLATWPSMQRVAGASAMECRFEILDGPLVGRFMVLEGSGFTYDALPLPKTGTVATLRYLAPDLSPLADITGLAQAAGPLRTSPAPQALLLGGNDLLDGGNGHDSIVGGAGDDDIDGFSGNDRLDGGLGNDTIRGAGGHDVLKGDAGDDELVGGFDRDVIRAGAGDDLIRYAQGTELAAGELVDGGAGFDTVLMLGGVYDFTDADLMNVEALRFASSATAKLTRPMLLDIERITLDGAPGDTPTLALDGTGNWVLDAFDLVAATGTQLKVQLLTPGARLFGRESGSGRPEDFVTGSSGQDTVILGGGDDTALGEAGNDILDGGEGDDSLRGGAGNDIIDGGDGADALVGDAGNDMLRGKAGNDSMLGGEGADTLDGGSDGDEMRGGTGDDVYLVDSTSGDEALEDDSPSGGYDTVVTTVDYQIGAGIEALTGNAVNISLHGNAAGNLVTGGAGSQTLNGHGGNDTLVGGLGTDHLTGGAGADDFVFRAANESVSSLNGRDRIHDFSRVEGDIIDLSQIDANTGLAGNQAFASFGMLGVGPAPAAGALRWTVQNGSTIVYGYTNDVAGADFAIELLGINGALSSDFVF